MRQLVDTLGSLRRYKPRLAGCCFLRIPISYLLVFTMSSGAALDIVDAAAADYPTVTKSLKNEPSVKKPETYLSTSEELVGPNGEQYPTVQDWSTLRRVYGKVNWMIYVIGIVEMCERFAYYGTTAVCT